MSQHYPNMFFVRLSDEKDKLCLSIRTGEDRSDEYHFNHSDCEFFKDELVSDCWIGGKNLKVKAEIRKGTGKLKILKGHCVSTYRTSAHAIQTLVAQIDALSDNIIPEEIEDYSSEDNPYPQMDMDLLKTLLENERKIILSEIDLRLQRLSQIEHKIVETKVVETKIIEKEEKKKPIPVLSPNNIFIPSNIGSNLSGTIKSTKSNNTRSISDVSKKLKELKK